MAIGKEGNVKWVDGLRGLASALVVLTHLARAFDVALFQSTSHEHAAPRFLQWPYVRVLIQGRIGVSIFSFVTGYVCALKPIKLCRQGNQEAAFKSIGRSALRRVPRLVLPTAIITLIIWFFAQFGAFKIAKHCDSFWAGATSPDVPRTMWGSVKDLVTNLVVTWTWGHNRYDGNHWTLMPLLKGSFWIYVFMLGTGYVQQKYRMLACIGMYFYFWMAGDATFGMQFFWGVFLSDLQNNEAAAALLNERRRLCRLLSAALLVFGFTIASFPEGHPEWMPWSQAQKDFMTPILPRRPDYPRFASGIGLEFITLGLHFNPWLRDMLATRPLLWLGKQSFAVYLLHGPLIRTVLVWMLYGTTMPPNVKNKEGKIVPGRLKFPGTAKLGWSLLIWIPMNYGAAMLWTGYVDPWCARITERLVGRIMQEPDEKVPATLPR